MRTSGWGKEKNLFTECCTQATSPQVAPASCNDIVSSILCWIERDNPVISQSLDSLSALPHVSSHTHQARELKQPKHKKNPQLIFKTSLLCHTSSCLHTIEGVRATIQGHTWETYLLHHWTDLPELPPSSWSDLCSCFHCRHRSEGRMGLFAPLHERTAGETNLSFQTWNIQHLTSAQSDGSSSQSISIINQPSPQHTHITEALRAKKYKTLIYLDT